MTIRIRAFGIAKDILSATSLTYEIPEGCTVSQLKSLLLEDYPDFERLKSLSFAINESYVEDIAEIAQGDEVVLIPPVSGG
jgi:molybdopterin synthase sulfur carrier subunit